MCHLHNNNYLPLYNTTTGGGDAVQLQLFELPVTLTECEARKNGVVSFQQMMNADDAGGEAILKF